MTAIFPDLDKKKTEEAMQDPQVGDEFTEMYTFFFFVIAREGDRITVMETPPERPCVLPRDGIVKVMTLDEFKQAYSYDGGKSGYWVRLCQRGVNVDGWVRNGCSR